MEGFLLWLYGHYIKPEIDASPKGDYEVFIDALNNELSPSSRKDLDKLLEFTAIRAFMLGLRTGEGLAESEWRPPPVPRYGVRRRQ